MTPSASAYPLGARGDLNPFTGTCLCGPKSHHGAEARPPSWGGGPWSGVLTESQVQCVCSCSDEGRPEQHDSGTAEFQGNPPGSHSAHGGPEPRVCPWLRTGLRAEQWALSHRGPLSWRPHNQTAMRRGSHRHGQSVFGGSALSGRPAGSAASAHTGDRSTRWADWLLLSQGLSFEEAVPGRVPFICSARRSGEWGPCSRVRDLSPM